MTAPLLALSLSSSFTQVGAIAAFAGLVGIAVMSLLFFSQARELKRLREWAEDAPARQAELEQRIGAAVALRIQRATAQIARPVEAKAPPARAVSTAPVTKVAEGAPAVAMLPAAPIVIGSLKALAAEAPAAGLEPVAASTAEPERQAEGSISRDSEEISALAAVGAAEAVASSSAAAPTPAAASPSTAALAPAAASPSTAALAPAAASPSAVAPASTVPPRAVAPASAVPARAAAPPRSPTPPAPSRRSPERSSVPSGPRRGATLPPSGGRSQPPRRVVKRPRGGPPPGPPFLREERNPARGRLLIAVGAIVVLVLLVVVFASSGGSSGGKGAATTPSSSSSSSLSSTSTRSEATRTASHESSTVATAPSETHVVVLNGTETGGLAHRLSGNLQQSGYTLATALNGHPPGTHATTVVEYSPGHRVDAQHVGQTLGVSNVKALDSATAALAGSATVVVVAGNDQVTAAPAGEGPPAEGTAGASG